MRQHLPPLPPEPGLLPQFLLLAAASLAVVALGVAAAIWLSEPACATPERSGSARSEGGSNLPGLPSWQTGPAVGLRTEPGRQTANGSFAQSLSASSPRSANAILHVARRYIGTNPTGRAYLWCMDFVNHVLRHAGRETTGSRAARSALRVGRKVSRTAAQAGDIVVSARRGGGHVGIFVRWANEARSRYVAVSGNSCGPRGRRHVCERTYPAGRILGFRRL